MNYEQALLDIAAERANNDKLEVRISSNCIENSLIVFLCQAVRSNLERQIKDLRERLNSTDGSVNETLRSRVAAAEARNVALEQQIDLEVRLVFL